MGNKQVIPGISEEDLDEYVDLTYLSRSEIVFLLKRFYSIGPEWIDCDFHHRFHRNNIIEKFPALKFNPFQDRIFTVFSTDKDDCLSFEDMLDLCSVMSENCPESVKASWAFRIYDLDDDNQIDSKDLFEIIDRLTWDRTNPTRIIAKEDKEKICKVLMDEMDLQHVGSIGPAEFQHMISKFPEIKNTFYFKV